MSKKLKIGLFGFGVVGQGLHDIISSTELNIEIRKIVIRDPSKERTLDSDLFTTDADLVLNDPEINTVVELISDAEAAYHIVKRALQSGKDVVSANKKMIAEHFQELVEIQEREGTSLLYEGAVCGSIPIIRNLEEYYDHELLHAVSGIFNGSSNYILSQIANSGLSYAEALKDAQDLGFAELNPLLDVGGYDAKFKLLIVAGHAYGLFLKPEDILNLGIQNFHLNDLAFARSRGLKLKLVPTAFKSGTNELALYVLPKFVPQSDFLYNVENEYNAVSVRAAFADQQLFYGKGAGGHPTGSAVLSDITALRYHYKYEYKKAKQNSDLRLNNEENIAVYIRYSDESLISGLSFQNIIDQGRIGDEQYVIGLISISELKNQQAVLESSACFIAEAQSLLNKDLSLQGVAEAQA